MIGDARGASGLARRKSQKSKDKQNHLHTTERSDTAPTQPIKSDKKNTRTKKITLFKSFSPKKIYTIQHTRPVNPQVNEAAPNAHTTKKRKTSRYAANQKHIRSITNKRNHTTITTRHQKHYKTL